MRKLMLLVLACVGLEGCANLGVQPWEREVLARDDMQLDANALGLFRNPTGDFKRDRIGEFGQERFETPGGALTPLVRGVRLGYFGRILFHDPPRSGLSDRPGLHPFARDLSVDQVLLADAQNVVDEPV